MKIYWILPNNISLSGAIDDYNQLEKEEINIVINCRAEQHDDIYELSKRNIAYFWIPVVDGLAPRSSQIDTFLKIVTNQGRNKVLVHCAVGRGRSAMLIAAYLISLGISMEQALEMIKKIKKDVSLTTVQKKKLEQMNILPISST